MLVLSRKVGEGIMIGDDVEIRVLEMRGGQVRLGIKAPKNVRVDRFEVREAQLKKETEIANSKQNSPTNEQSPTEDIYDHSDDRDADERND
jgi:carbon storage regulator